MNQISLLDQLKNHRRHLSDEHAQFSHSVLTSSKDSCDPASLPRPPLENGERVVWISDTGPELGTVRWIGILPDSRIMEYTIGVEFVSTKFLCHFAELQLYCNCPLFFCVINLIIAVFSYFWFVIE